MTSDCIVQVLRQRRRCDACSEGAQRAAAKVRNTDCVVSGFEVLSRRPRADADDRQEARAGDVVAVFRVAHVFRSDEASESDALNANG